MLLEGFDIPNGAIQKGSDRAADTRGSHHVFTDQRARGVSLAVDHEYVTGLQKVKRLVDQKVVPSAHPHSNALPHALTASTLSCRRSKLQCR